MIAKTRGSKNRNVNHNGFKGRYAMALTALLALNANKVTRFSHAFVPSSFSSVYYHQHHQHHQQQLSSSFQHRHFSMVNLNMMNEDSNLKINMNGNDGNDDDTDGNDKNGLERKSKRNVLKNPKSLAFLTAAAISSWSQSQSSSTSSSLFHPPLANAASAPIVAVKKFEVPDIKNDALKKYREEISTQKLKKAMAHQVKCEEIEAEKGPEARREYERRYDAVKRREEENKKIQRKRIMYESAMVGMCPFTDVEGARRLFLHDEGIDLNHIPATPQNKELIRLQRFPKQQQQRVDQRFIVKCIVEDIQLKGEDPLAYLETHKQDTLKVYELKEKQASAIAQRYKSIIEQQKSLSGEISETPFDIQSAIGGASAASASAEKSSSNTRSPQQIAKEQQKIAKAQAKEKAKLEKMEQKKQKSIAKAEAAKLKAEQKLANQQLKIQKEKEEAAAKAQELVLSKQQSEEIEKSFAASDSVEDGTSTIAVEQEEEERMNEETTTITTTTTTALETTKDTPTSAPTIKSSSLPIVPVTSVVGIAGAAYVFKMSKDKSAKDEEERQRQFKLIMGIDEEESSSSSNEINDNDDNDILNLTDTINDATPIVEKETAKVNPTPTTSEKSKQKRRKGGLSSVFSKKSNLRETDINALVVPDAIAPAFASILAKILTFGAPGRFPAITEFPGGMPMDTFDLDTAKELLIAQRASDNLTNDISAETFACVVNCMIIDIIDLASSTLGVKDNKDKVTVDALNVVMDFMDHAASLFDAVAEGVTITPVTYGGTLGKSKLEKMFGIYASSMMTNFDGGVTQDRVDTLQQVLNINDKRAEGLVQKTMMKSLMNMMKDGGKGMEGMEGMEGLSEMMAAMGGDGADGGFPGLGGLDGGDVSPEELKQSVSMMKDLVDSGSVSKEELDLVRSQFKEVYGSDISDLIKEADQKGAAEELGKDGKELLVSL
eukprot:CAMPEP_0184859220 /NCGR_PEP_ID=MMETSP0580-20130426/4216_1 /TAXON_ID=1118495 /ORGANISM="Dactyliosolen fragilissimus" /LENGTH=946 /DNA_ID=CAMNT_0027355721 /DNA_START=1 /DNA_END=2841 /DNA_ORIENTATION=-